MNQNAVPHISGYAQLKKLRTALAISQGAKLLLTLQQEAEATISHDQTKRVTYLTGLFSRIHRELFHHWKEQASVSHRPGIMADPDKRKIFRKTVGRLVLDDESNRETAIFDNNGFVIRTENIAERLADFYLKMRSVRPFAYGNRLTLDLFMTALGKLPAFKAVYGQGIDFRRLDAQDARALHDPASSFREVTAAFQHVLDATRGKYLQNIPNGYGKWPENKRFVSSIPFLSHTTADGIACLVMVNGGLVPIDSIREDAFSAGKHLADYAHCPIESIIGYLPGTEALRAPGKNTIDAMPVGEDGTAPLFCLDVNILTGLRMPGHIELLDLLKQCAGSCSTIFALANNAALKHKMLIAADGDERLARGVEIAYERLGKITESLDAAVEELFEGKTPVDHPKLFMCMGGAGAGKTLVEKIAKAQCGENFVIASLDEFRKKCDLYCVLTAAEHHSDDYIYVEPFANRLRDLVAERAQREGFNILYDGTGIPYSSRYAAIIAQFKQCRFYTQIIAVDAFLVKPPGREEQLLRSTVIGSIQRRYRRTGRALPWVVAIYKHIHAPDSFLCALEDMALDKISLFANDSERDKHYLVAESFAFSDEDVHELQECQKAGTLTPYLQSVIKNRYGSTLKNLARDDEAEIEAAIAKNPAFVEHNVAYQVYPGSSGNRVLAIYNTERMTDFVQKRQLNPHASHEEGLLFKPDALAFHVDPLAKESWVVRLQEPLGR